MQSFSWIDPSIEFTKRADSSNDAKDFRSVVRTPQRTGVAMLSNVSEISIEEPENGYVGHVSKTSIRITAKYLFSDTKSVFNC